VLVGLYSTPFASIACVVHRRAANVDHLLARRMPERLRIPADLLIQGLIEERDAPCQTRYHPSTGHRRVRH